MTSTTERPFTFFYNFINNFNAYVENDFFINYENQLNCNHIDRVNGIIDHSEIDCDNNPVFYREKLQDFLQKKIIIEFNTSNELVGDNIRKLSALSSDPTNYLKEIENDLIELYKLSEDFNDIFLNEQLLLTIIKFNVTYNRFISFKKELLLILSINKSNVILKKKVILSFEWNTNNHPEKLELLYNKLISTNPPFIDCEFIIFKKAFTGQEIHLNEGIKWLCKSVKNKNIISKVTLVRFIEMLYEKQYIKSDKNDLNKIVENIFLSSDGEKIKNIKVSKREKSQTPSRIKELIEIVDSLT